MSEWSLSERDPVEELAKEFLARCRRGERPALSEYTHRYPQWEEKIRRLFPLLVDIEAARPAAVEGPSTGGVLVGADQQDWSEWAITRCCGRSAAAAWASSMRRCKSPWAGMWP